MHKFLNTLSLCLAILAIGSWLNATPYPIGSLFPLVSDGIDVTMETGKFGIGTSNPQELLHVGAGTDASDITATDLLVTRAGPSNLSVRDSTNDVETFLFASTVGGIIGTVTNDPLEIKTNNTSAISIDTSQNVGIPTLTASEIVITDASKNLVSAAVATYPSLAEFIHVKGVTSALQTQLDGKQPLDSELTTIAALTETNSNVMFVAGGVWTSDPTPAIDCTDCTNLPGADGFTDPTAINTWTADQTFNDSVNLTFGTDGDADIDFDGSNLIINSQASGTGHVVITETTSGSDASRMGTLNIETTDAGTQGPKINLFHNSSTPANNDVIARITWAAKDSGGTERQVVQFNAQFEDVTSTTMDSRMRFVVMDNVNAANFNTTAQITSLGVFTDASGADRKTYEGQIQSIYGERILDKLDTLFVSRYHSRRAVDIKERHISPTAEDLWDSFGVGTDPRLLDQDTDGDGVVDAPTPGIAAKDLAGIALVAIQELNQKVKALEAELTRRGSLFTPPSTNPGPPMPPQT